MAQSLAPAALRSRSLAAGFLRAIGSLMENDSRLRRVRALQALSDAELAERGIPRDRIVHHVFGPYMGF